MGRSRRKRRVGDAGFFGIPTKPKQSPASRIFREDLPHLRQKEKRLRELEELTKAQPIMTAQFENSQKGFVKLLEHTILTIETAKYTTQYRDSALDELHAELMDKLVEYKLKMNRGAKKEPRKNRR